MATRPFRTSMIAAVAVLVGSCSRPVAPGAITSVTPPPPPHDARAAGVHPLASFALTAETRRALEAVEPDLAGRRVVMLGEPDHYIHEKYAYQLLFVRWLFERGFRHVGFEMGRASGRQFDRYLATGDEKWFHSSAKTKATRELPKGMLSVDAHAGWIVNDQLERDSFMRALRRLNESRKPGTPPLHVFGFDVDFFLADAVEEVLWFFDGHHLDAIEAIRSLLDNGPADLDRVVRTRKIASEHAAALRSEIGEAQYGELMSTLREVEETARFTAVAMHEPTLEQLMESFAHREQTMFWQVDEQLARAPAEEGIVLLGHNMHLSKDPATIRSGGPDAAPMWPSIGSHLAQTLGEKAYGVWMLYARGTHGQHKCRDLVCPIVPPPGTVETRLEGMGERFLLPLRAGDPATRFLFDDASFIQNGELGSGRIGRQTDLVVFVRDVRAPSPEGAAELDPPK